MPSKRAAAALLPPASRSACSTCVRCASVKKFGSHVDARAMMREAVAQIEELSAFWDAALDAFKRIAEESG